MKVNIRKVIRPLDLGEKAQEYKGQIISVWMNPSQSFRMEHDSLLIEFAKRQKEMVSAQDKESAQLEFSKWFDGEFTDRNNEWFARLWSQDEKPETHWTLDEINELREADPTLFDWMKLRSTEMITDYRASEKKR